VGKPYKIKTSKLCCNKKKKQPVAKIEPKTTEGHIKKQKINRIIDESQINSRDTTGIMQVNSSALEHQLRRASIE
jgi:hypothetical protein